MIFGLAGKQGSGKDTFLELMKKAFKGDDLVIVNTSDIIIRGYAKNNGLRFNTVKNNKQAHRVGLQMYGDRNRGVVLAVAFKIIHKNFKTNHIVYNSVRVNAEINLLDSYECKYLLLKADRDVRQKRRKQLIGENHKSETEAFDTLIDYHNCFHVDNNSNLEALNKRCEQIMMELCLK